MKKISITLIITVLALFFYSHLIQANHSSEKNTPSQRPKLIKIQDIRETARQAQSQNLPILIMFGTDECPYCQLLKEDFLIPMLISGDYTDKVLIREAHISPETDIIDFSGKKISIGEFSSRYGVTLFPTMVFIDSNGVVLVKNIIGITTPSLFGGTLDDSIDKALLLTKKKRPTN
ncbi:MAG: thioredoxin fold domain-containing protein [Gammaproteobacteria bacterium]|nr:thioredoxin fold domain-containing protein [Gammaproteobacteria bacterium]